jgi:hypothetical protein
MQPEQVRSLVADPAADTYCPAEHDDHATHEVDGLLSWSHVPDGHACSLAVPPAQYVPTAHGAHVGSLVAVPGLVCLVPGAQAPCAMHVLWFEALVNVPAAHAEHVRSSLVEPGALT